MTILLFCYIKRKFTCPIHKTEISIYGNITGSGTTLKQCHLELYLYNKLKGKFKYVGVYVFTISMF